MITSKLPLLSFWLSTGKKRSTGRCGQWSPDSPATRSVPHFHPDWRPKGPGREISNRQQWCWSRARGAHIIAAIRNNNIHPSRDSRLAFVSISRQDNKGEAYRLLCQKTLRTFGLIGPGIGLIDYGEAVWIPRLTASCEVASNQTMQCLERSVHNRATIHL